MNSEEPVRVWLLRLQNQCVVPVSSLSGEFLKGSPNQICTRGKLLWEGWKVISNDLHAEISFTPLCYNWFFFTVLGTS